MSIEITIPTKIVDQIVTNTTKYPADYKKSSILYALTTVQNHNGGWVKEDDMKQIAEILNIDYINVYEVATFYSMIKLKPVGKYLISVCTNISCKLNNAENIALFIKEYLGIDYNETTSDEMFTLEHAECLAACIRAPALLINGIYHENVTKDSIKKTLDELSSKGDQHGK